MKIKKIVELGVCGICLWGMSSVSVAQGPPATPVRYTEARSHQVRQQLRLPGTIEAPTLSPVASEVEGMVIKLLATEGTEVRKGSPLARLRKSNLELRLRSVMGELKEAAARKARAGRVLDRARELLEQELVSPGEFDDADAEFNAWDGRVEKLQADIERIELDISRCTIRSPIDGVVVAEHVEVGGWIGVGDGVMDVLATKRLEVRVELPARNFQLIKKNERAVVHLASGEEILGEVDAIIPLADTGSRVFPVKVGIDNPDGRIVSGMLVEVFLFVGDPEGKIIVPKDAVVARGPMKFVLIIDDENMAQQVSVTTGAGVGDWIVVEGDLVEGQKVVTRGNERVFPGQPVEGEPLAYDLP